MKVGLRVCCRTLGSTRPSSPSGSSSSPAPRTCRSVRRAGWIWRRRCRRPSGWRSAKLAAAKPRQVPYRPHFPAQAAGMHCLLCLSWRGKCWYACRGVECRSAKLAITKSGKGQECEESFELYCGKVQNIWRSADISRHCMFCLG